MAEENYQVSSPAVVAERFRQLVVVARERGMLPIVLPAVRWIMEELARTPMQFGEARGFLPHMQLHMRIGFAGPISVQFGVHEQSRQVFIREFRLRT